MSISERCCTAYLGLRDIPLLKVLGLSSMDDTGIFSNNVHIYHQVTLINKPYINVDETDICIYIWHADTKLKYELNKV